MVHKHPVVKFLRCIVHHLYTNLELRHWQEKGDHFLFNYTIQTAFVKNIYKNTVSHS